MSVRGTSGGANPFRCTRRLWATRELTRIRLADPLLQTPPVSALALLPATVELRSENDPEPAHAKATPLPSTPAAVLPATTEFWRTVVWLVAPQSTASPPPCALPLPL